MNELFDKLSSYNLFNYLLPGILFVCLSKYFLGYDFIQDNQLIGGFLYYFLGMVISRVGSIFIEPFLKKIRFLKFAHYKHFVEASRIDDKVELLSEVNNTYRTITSMLVILLILKGSTFLKPYFQIANIDFTSLLVVCLLILFLFSYRKQTNFIRQRIDINKLK